MSGIIITILLFVIAFLIYKVVDMRKQLKRYLPIIQDIESTENLASAINQAQQRLSKLNQEIKDVEQQISIYKEDLKMLDLGVYEPHFDFGTPEQYQDKIKSGRIIQKEMIKNGTAIYCTTEWTVGNSKSEGRKMTERAIRLTARAFNNECEAIVSNVNWNNINRMQERLIKAFNDINKLNQTNQIIISNEYLELKLAELQLVYEYQEKLKQEKERQAEIRQQMREEARLEQEIIKAQQEEVKYQKLLLKAQQQAQQAVGQDLEKLNAEILELTQKLQEAHQKNERAISMAQQTRVGHVYIISNIGSFGENVYKIGMTRRLEPMERVYELGDASVPFLFDVHAMIYSEDAPALERALHQAFANKRLNLVNHRKEFFNVSLNEIKQMVDKLNINAEFITIAEAQEYNQSRLIREQNNYY